MGAGGSPGASDSVQGLQTALHAKAKGDPAFRFCTLSDKVWREDLLREAWRAVRRNGGACGVDGETFEHIPKKQPGKFRPPGMPCIRDRVAQAAAMLVLTPIFEADLPAEQYACRGGRSAQDAVRHVHRLVNWGRQEIVDADLSNYLGWASYCPPVPTEATTTAQRWCLFNMLCYIH